MAHRLVRFIAFAAAFAVFAVAGPAPAAAQPAAGTMGAAIMNMFAATSNFHNILSTISYIAGMVLGVMAIFKFKDHVDQPLQHPISGGVKRLIAGSMFLSLPYMLVALRGSIFGNNNFGTVGDEIAVSGWGTATLTPGGLDKMVVDMMINVGGPMEILLASFSYIAAIAFLLVGISRLTKRMEEGPRGPAGFGTIMTFIAAGMLFSFGESIGLLTSSIFGDASLMTQANINSTVISNVTDRQKIQKVIEALLVFMMIVGYIAFIRGWFVLKSFADGQQGATLAQGLTFLIGGALAINLGEFINALGTTVGITALTFN